MNENRPNGNQKHIDLSGRIRIEQGLNDGESFRSIARDLNKDPSTISKEGRRHSILKEDRWNLECDVNGEIRTRIYYCDPNRSDQKSALEKNHEYIRYVLPKRISFEHLTEETTLLLLNHINSEKHKNRSYSRIKSRDVKG